MRVAALRRSAWLFLALLVPACSVGGGSGTLTPTVAPGAPDGIGVRAGNHSATIDWSASAQGAQYAVLRSILPQGPFFPVSTPSQFRGPTSYVDTGLSNGTTYYYQIVAYNDFGQSAPSAIASGSPGFKAKAVSARFSSLDAFFAATDVALLTDGSVWEWGQLHSSSVVDVPVPVANLPDIAAVSCGQTHNLALSSDGRVWGWGHNTYGQLGDLAPPNTYQSGGVQSVSLPDVIAVAAGGQFSLALRHDGTVWAWGYNGDGELGLGTSSATPSPTPAQVPGLSNIVAIAAGDMHALALRNDGLVFAWGDNTYGELGRGSASATPLAVGEVGSLTGITAISAGPFRSVALRNDGTIWAWGYSASGPIVLPTLDVLKQGFTAIGGEASTVGIFNDETLWNWTAGTPATPGTPARDTTLTHLVSVHTCGSWIALGDDGTVWTWGDNSKGQLGNGTGQITQVPLQVPNFTGVTAVSGGYYTSFAIQAPGTVWGWGADGNGSLGDGTAAGSFVNQAAPVQTKSLTNAVALAWGNTFGLALLSTGDVWGWGVNNGQLGTGGTGVATIPVKSLTPTGMIAIACGDQYSLGIRNDGTLWAWGVNTNGQLGLGTVGGSKLSPTQVPGLAGVVAIAGGNANSAAALSDGTVWTWGNGSGTPTAVAGVSGVIDVKCGFNFTIALKADGTVQAWGDDTYGQLGIAALSGVTAISAGMGWSLALRNDGTVWACGDNSSGQLGSVSFGKSSTPVQVPILTGVTAIAAGNHHNLALRSNGTVWCWGFNGSNELGTPLVTQSLTPVIVGN
jgi:alpha-tubulin suppressor-like RCC1 family protein